MSSSALIEILEIEIAEVTFYVDLLQSNHFDRIRNVLFFAQESHQERVLDLREYRAKEGWFGDSIKSNRSFLPKITTTRYLSDERLVGLLRLSETNIFDAYHLFAAQISTRCGREFVCKYILNKQKNLCLEIEAVSKSFLKVS